MANRIEFLARRSEQFVRHVIKNSGVEFLLFRLIVTPALKPFSRCDTICSRSNECCSQCICSAERTNKTPAMREIDKNVLAREKLRSRQSSPFRTYMELTVGQVRLSRFLLYEILTSILGPMPSGVGFFLRKKFYPLFFKRTGEGLIIGRNVAIRHPDKIELGNNVTIDDNCLIDGRGSGSAGVVLEDDVIINRNCALQAKAGPIRLGKRTSIGSNSAIVSMDGVEFGETVLVAGGCYISAGAYHFDDVNAAVMDQGAFTKGPIFIGSKAWLGTGVIVLDGVSIGEGAVIGAGAVVVKDIPQYGVAVGNPARVIKVRDIPNEMEQC